MTQLTDTPRETLESILAQLRSHNPQIGEYVDSTLNPENDYAVQLDNGHVEIPARLVYEWGRVPPYQTEGTYRSIAAGFVPGERIVPAEEGIPIVDPAIVPESRSARARRMAIMAILIVLAVIFLLTLAL